MIIAARVPDELKVKIEDLAEREGKTVSEIMRQLLEDYVREKEEEWHRVRVCIRIPRNLLNQVDLFVEKGYALDREHVISESVSLWLRVKKMEYRRNWKEELINALDESSLI
ncbi:Ribbon-helix-helix protein, copG family [Aciduliprofundum sp. MAR08-339]|uniref:CopG family ribbon-helix-helix protein n=1 Tax=Aciduliprofundum sp. (strain MAR08-339) TaxID=673860 RepID=UPI0002A49AED|nr:Ribbon-helix-helix protein, copG family [Aciduliprofundum sp. MAR08-339]